ncbi:carboxylate-amine ligase [Geoalkalibacter sp.]|uniref:carboxylate-amine ligase n=1 Tax=Geoalkalibacter sp. TaxID=3041440 RepID=UPI00272E3F2F|nr:glutamate-cysteine ligase family protein [Geoalkalibacter sp.]
MRDGRPLGLFEGFGIELEYMIVDRDTLAVKPLCDRLLEQVAGQRVSEVERGTLSWSNELVLHVVEFKTNGPAPRLAGLAAAFQDGVARANALLAPLGACLLPGAMHPWMDPARETRLWPYDNRPIYEAYNRIFDCRCHGWSNLQSTHLNLPFADDAEFGRLHAAIRLILPLLPALAASSPIVAGRATGALDNRLLFYRDNQKALPSITGQVVPEAVYTRAAYEQEILAAMYRAIAPLDPQGLLQEEWLNSRGAIARFERNTIEIRVLDIQECPLADLAVAGAIVAVLRALSAERWCGLARQQGMPLAVLAPLFVATAREGERARIGDGDYLACFGLPARPLSAGELWRHLAAEVATDIPEEYRPALQRILRHGPLARRILDALPAAFDQGHLRELYGRLARCLERGEMF